MRVITEAVPGLIIQEDDRAAVRLSEPSEDGPKVYLAFALVTLGPEEHVFPCLVLDDWGKEMTGLTALAWMADNGAAFPRAEIFAVGRAGDERQHFLREFELYSRYPVYALSSRKTPITEAVRIQAMVISDESVAEPTRIKRPADINGPLTRARLSWWRVPPSHRGLDFLTAQQESS